MGERHEGEVGMMILIASSLLPRASCPTDRREV